MKADLPEGRQAGTACEPDGRVTIAVPRTPKTALEAHILAHEYMHLCLEAEGYPTVRGIEPLASTIGSTVLDPLVERRLTDYGFDFLEQQAAECRTNVALMKEAAIPRDQVGVLHWAFNVLGMILDDELATSMGAEMNPRLEEVRSRIPRIFSRAEQLRELGRTTGLDDPAEITRFYCRVIFENGLLDHLEVVTYKPA